MQWRHLKKSCLWKSFINLGMPENMYYSTCEKHLSRQVEICSWRSCSHTADLTSSWRKPYWATSRAQIRPLSREHLTRSFKVRKDASFQRMISSWAPTIGSFLNYFLRKSLHPILNSMCSKFEYHVLSSTLYREVELGVI